MAEGKVMVVTACDIHHLWGVVFLTASIHQREELMTALRVSDFRATHDPLTGLWNRVAILDTLARELAWSERELTALGLLIGDLDHFKDINDRYGHLAGVRY
jgi:two-component system, cell cycle response regulator